MYLIYTCCLVSICIMHGKECGLRESLKHLGDMGIMASGTRKLVFAVFRLDSTVVRYVHILLLNGCCIILAQCYYVV